MTDGKTKEAESTTAQCGGGTGDIIITVRRSDSFVSLASFGYTIEGPEWEQPKKGTAPDEEGEKLEGVKAGTYTVTIEPGDMADKYAPKESTKTTQVASRRVATVLFLVRPQAGISVEVVDKTSGKAVPCESIKAKHQGTGKTFGAKEPASDGKAEIATGLSGHYTITLTLDEHQAKKYGKPDPAEADIDLGPHTAVKIELEQKRRIALASVSDHFAPSKEKLKIEYEIGGLAADTVKLQILATKKSGEDPELVYERELTEQEKADGKRTIETWDGKCDKGVLKDKYANPLHSPYTARLFFDNTVKDEKQFKALYHSIAIKKGPWVPGDAPVKADGKKWAQYRLNELGYYGGPVDHDTEDYFKKAIMRFKYRCPALRKDDFKQYNDTLDDTVKTELEKDDCKRTWLTEDAFADPDKESRIYQEMITYQRYTLLGVDTWDFFSKNKWDAEAERLNRPIVPLEVEIKLKKRDSDEGIDVPEAVGPVRVNWRFTDPEEDLSGQYTPTEAKPSRVQAYLSEALKIKDGRKGKGDNAPEVAKGLRKAADDDYETPFWLGTNYEPYDVKKDTGQKVVYSTAYTDKATYPNRVGKAGVYFRPSLIAGDAYKLKAELDFTGHDNKKNLETFHDCTDAAKRISAETGTFRVWRNERVALVIQWPQTLPKAPEKLNIFGATDKAGVKEEYAKAYIDLDFDTTEFKKISDIISEADYKTLVHDKAGYAKADVSLKDECVVGIVLPDQEALSATDYKALLNEKVNTDYFDKMNFDLISLVLKKARPTYPWGIIIIQFHLHEPKTVSYPNAKIATTVDTKYMTGTSSMGLWDGCVLLSQSDTDALYYVAAHEMGHNFFLKHWEVDQQMNEKEHDNADHNCVMSYTYRTAAAHRQPDVYRPHFCGRCNLHLRGWKVDAAGVPARSDDAIKLADIEFTQLTVDPVWSNPGEKVTSTIEVKCKGPQKVTGLEIQITAPPDQDFEGVKGAAPAGTVYDNATHVWTINELAKDATKKIELEWKPKEAAAGTYYYHKCILKKQNENFTARDDKGVGKTKPAAVHGVRLSVSATDSSIANPAVGDECTITYTLKNEARADSGRPDSTKAENVEFTVSVQAGLEIASGTASVGAFTVGTGKWAVGDLAKGASATLTAKVKPKLDGAGKTLKITGEVSACDQKDAWAKKLWKVEKEVTVKNQCALAVSIDADEKKPKKDKEFGISAEVKNSGPHPATSVVILVQKPGAFTFLEKNASDGVYAPDGRWTIPSLAKDARATLDIRAKVAPKAKNKAQDITIAVQSCNEGDSGKGTAAWSKSVTVTPKGKCFLTTACVQGMGLPDDCHELQVLRAFRDTYLLSQPAGAREIEEYYAVAPTIVDAINNRADAVHIWQSIYDDLVRSCVAHVEAEHPEDALGHYRTYVERLRTEYVTTVVPLKEVEA